MATFLTSASLENKLNNGVSYTFQNNGSTYCLYANCDTQLGANATYSPRSSNDSPTTHGFYLPTVSSQNELNSNHGKFVTSGFADLYIWFQPNEDNEFILTTGSTLTYGDGTPVEGPSGPVSAATVEATNLRITAGGGTVIILGVMDMPEEQ